MYHYLFYFFYKYYNRPKWKEKNFPFFSTVLVISALLMLNFLFIRDLIAFQLNGIRYKHFPNENFFVPTIFIAMNYWYFKKNDRFKKILTFHRNTSKKNNLKFYTTWVYIVLSVVLVIIMGYCIRNNIRWI